VSNQTEDRATDEIEHTAILVAAVSDGIAADLRRLSRRTRLIMVALGLLALFLILLLALVNSNLHGKIDAAQARVSNAELHNSQLIQCLTKPTEAELQACLGTQAAVAGQPGVAGGQGAIGKQGPPGATGPAGPRGASGAQGKTGGTGPRGATGSPGQRGAPGPQGATGAHGAQGPQGPEGPRGPRGRQGDRGALGGRGPQGLPGTSPTRLICVPIGQRVFSCRPA